jgi:uncharacterized membrane protein
MDKESARIEAFSDNVFAVAITLLILEIRIPDGSSSNLLIQLIKQWPSYLAFFISFAFIGIMWTNHHRLFTYIHRSNDTLLFLNLLLLLGVCVVPFSTAVLAKNLGNSGQRAATVLYNAVYFVISLLFNLLWRYCVAKDHYMLGEHVDIHSARKLSFQYGFGPLLYLFCVVLAWISIYASLVMNCLMALFFALPPSHLVRLWRGRQQPQLSR